MRKRRVSSILAMLLALGMISAVASADPSVSPASVEEIVYPGESVDIAKTVGTPSLPPKVDVCLMEDETGSFGDDITNLKNPATIAAIFNGVRTGSPDSQFAVAGFRDYEMSPFGNSGDWVYRLLSPMSPDFTAWSDGINALTAGGGNDIPEALFDAVVAAADGPTDYEPDSLGSQADCGWRADPDVTRVLVVTTDAPSHSAGDGTHAHSLASATAALVAEDITVIGLKASGAGTELDSLATATGGSVQALSSDGSNIAAAILAGLSNLPVEVSLTSDCVAPISTSFLPPSSEVTSGDDALFTETIAVAGGAAGGTYECTDTVVYDGTPSDVIETKTIHVPGIDLTPGDADNELAAGTDHTVTATVTAGDAGPQAGVTVEFEIVSGPNVGLTGSDVTDANGEATFTWSPGAIDSGHLGVDTVVATFTDGSTVEYGFDTATKTWIDTTLPTAACLADVNPAGHVPTAPGKGGKGQNQDGFYVLDGSDTVWATEDLSVYVVDTGSGTVFGPYPVGTVIKYTEDDDATPEAKPMGGPSSEVDWHIIGTGDAEVRVVDGSGNVGIAYCLVPPPPM